MLKIKYALFWQWLTHYTRNGPNLHCSIALHIIHSPKRGAGCATYDVKVRGFKVAAKRDSPHLRLKRLAKPRALWTFEFEMSGVELLPSYRVSDWSLRVKVQYCQLLILQDCRLCPKDSSLEYARV